MKSTDRESAAQVNRKEKVRRTCQRERFQLHHYRDTALLGCTRMDFKHLRAAFAGIFYRKKKEGEKESEHPSNILNF